MGDESRGTVWASTWVPGASPIEGFGADGYAACWIDVPGTGRIQALVKGSAPQPGQAGKVRSGTPEGGELPIFEADAE